MGRLLSERLWERVRKTSRGKRCWIWTGALTHGTWGYGRMSVYGKQALVHRLTWELANGPIPEGMKVLHSCDRPECCNPAHLFLGTQAENLRDMLAKGRHARASAPGESNGAAVLTAKKVAQIRAAYPAESLRVLGLRFGVSKSQVSRIVNGGSW